jgi:uncharacterized membrane protein
MSIAPAGLSNSKRIPGWLTALIIALIVFNALPFVAPVFMKLGWESAGRLIYLAYWPLCHQMAQRSFFLFGPEGFQMYTIAQLPVKVSGSNAELVLKQFLGSEALGWKVAWSDRMVTFYGGPLVAAVVHAIARVRGRVKAWPLWIIGSMLLPMILDGATHMASDMLSGIGHGFRDTNQWLAVITGNLLPATFVQGDTLGSFNSWMRLVSGLLFGFAIGWFALPYIDSSTAEITSLMEHTYRDGEVIGATVRGKLGSEVN